MFKLLEHLFIFSFIDNCAVYLIAFLPFYFKCKHSNDSTLKQTARCFFNTALHINLRQRLFFFWRWRVGRNGTEVVCLRRVFACF